MSKHNTGSFSPSAEDIVIQAEKKSFDYKEVKKALDEVNKNVEKVTGKTAEDIIEAYKKDLENGADPIEEPVVVEWSEEEREVARNELEKLEKSHDINIAKADCGCQAVSNCCIESIVVKDTGKDAVEREIAFPVDEGKGTKILTVATFNDEKAISKVNVTVVKEKCKQGIKQIGDLPIVAARSTGEYGDADYSETIGSSTDLELEYSENGVSAYNKMPNGLPEHFKVAYAFFKMISDGESYDNGFALGEYRQYNVETTQCSQKMGNITIVPYPEVSLTGQSSFALSAAFTTSGTNVTAEFKNNLSGRYGLWDFSKDKDLEHEHKETEREVDVDNVKSDGLMGVMLDVFDVFNKENKKSQKGAEKAKAKKYDVADYGSNVTLDLGLEVSLATKLVPVKNSPDLEFTVGGSSTKLTLGIGGKLDVLEAATVFFGSPGTAKLFNEGRAKLSAGEKVNADIRADLSLQATGSVALTFEKMKGFRILANPSDSVTHTQSDVSFAGKLHVTGKAILRLHVEAKVMLLEAAAGIEGTMNTGWVWDFESNKVNGVTQKRKRYTYEGLYAELKVYFEINIRDKPKEKLEKIGVSTDSLDIDVVANLNRDIENWAGAKRDPITGDTRPTGKGSSDNAKPNDKKEDKEDDEPAEIIPPYEGEWVEV